MQTFKADDERLVPVFFLIPLTFCVFFLFVGKKNFINPSVLSVWDL